MLKIKRVYEKPAKDDGYRVLIDRLWPRGLSKEKAKVKFWLRDIAPSSQLRQWFGHDPAKWREFRKKYLAELRKNPAVGQLKEISKKEKNVTLVYAAADTEHNDAVVLQEYF